MNKIYRTVWNKALGTFVAASELDRNGGKGSARGQLCDGRTGDNTPDQTIAFGLSGDVERDHGRPIWNGRESIVATSAMMAILGLFGGMSSAQAQVFFNDNNDAACAELQDTTSGTFITSTVDGRCQGGNLGSTQTAYSVFWGNGGTTNSLSLGGQLFVNSGQFGLSDQSGATYSMRVGSVATLNGPVGTNAIAIGSAQSSSSDGSSSTATVASAPTSIAIGSAATAANINGVAIGTNASVQTDNSVALGANSSTALPVATSSATIGSTTFGPFAGASPVGVVSVGAPGSERQITNVAAGQMTSSSTDAVNGSQLYSVATQLDKATASISSLSTGLSTTGSSVTSLSSSTSTGINSLSTSTLAGIDSLSTGLSTTSSGIGSLSTGLNTLSTSTSTGITSLSTGLSTTGSSVSSLSTVVSATRTHYYSVNDNGTEQSNYSNDGATGVNSMALGPNASASVSNGVAIGNGAVVSTANSVALGSNAVTAAANSTPTGTIGGQSYTYQGGAPVGVVSVGAQNAERQITNVAAGQVTGTSTDAVNGSQLFATNTAVNSLSTGVGNLSTGFSSLSTGLSTTNSNLASLSTSTSSGIGSLSTGVNSLSTGLSTTNSNVTSLSSSTSSGITSLSTGLSTANSNVGSLSTSASTGINSLSTGLSTTTSSVTSLSTSTSSGLSTTNSNLASLSTSTSTGLLTLTSNVTSLSTGLSSTNSNLTTLSTSTSTGLSSLSTGISSITTNTTALGTSTASALGGGATYDPATGKVSAPAYVTYNADGTTTTNNNVGDALNNISTKGTRYFHANSTDPDSIATGLNSVAIGPNAVASNDNSVAIGNDSTTAPYTPVPSVTIGGLLFGGFAGANPVGVFSVGSPGQERQVTNVAAGQITSSSTDAVNGSQLFATNSAVASLSTGLGATNANVASLSTSTSTAVGSLSTGLSTTNSNLTSLSTSTQTSVNSLSTGLSSTNNTVASLSTSVNNQVSSLSTSISNSSTTAANNNGIASDMNGKGTDKPHVTAGSNSVAIGANSNDGGRSNVVSMGSADQQRQVTNVAAGTQGTDAVNLNQLNATLSQANNYTNQAIGQLQQSVNNTARTAYSGIAAATALSMIPEVDQGKTLSMGVGVGSFQGYQAIAVGATARITNNIKMRAGVGTSSAGTAYGIGASMQW